jgi:hypothetical protein
LVEPPRKFNDFYVLTFMTLVLNHMYTHEVHHASFGGTRDIFHTVSNMGQKSVKSLDSFFLFTSFVCMEPVEIVYSKNILYLTVFVIYCNT